MVQRFRNFSLLFCLRYHRRTILMSPLSRTTVDNRSFVFDGNREQNRSSPGNSKNCSKESGFHVGKQAETFVPSSRQRLLIGRPILISFYGDGGTKFPKTAERRFVHSFVIEWRVGYFESQWRRVSLLVSLARLHSLATCWTVSGSRLDSVFTNQKLEGQNLSRHHLEV